MNMRLTLIATGVTGLLLVLNQNGLGADKDKEEWTQLFNGKDLTGWKIHPEANGDFAEIIEVKKDGKLVGYDAKLKSRKNAKPVHLWRVEEGNLIGSGPSSHLFTERDDFQNFIFRIQAKINDHGNSGQYFRTAFGGGFPDGYEAQINATHGDPIKTGSLYPSHGLGKFREKITIMNKAPHKPDEFFTQEVKAIGDTITISVDGKQTVEFKDPDFRFKKGHFALQGHDPGTVVTFKKIEVKELPANKE